MTRKLGFLQLIITSWACLSANAATNAIPLPLRSPLYRDWQTVARCDVIAKGQVVAPCIGTVRPGEKVAQIDILELAKGVTPLGVANIEYPSEPQTLFHSILDPGNKLERIVNAYQGQDVIVFLHRKTGVPRSDRGAGGFSSYEFEIISVKPFDAMELSSIHEESLNQNEISSKFSILPISKADGFDKEVHDAIEDVIELHNQDSWRRLTQLPVEALPAIVRQMDDTRRLPELDLWTKSSIRPVFDLPQYPTSVNEELTLLAQTLSSESFNRPFESEDIPARMRELNAWRSWLYYSDFADGLHII